MNSMTEIEENMCKLFFLNQTLVFKFWHNIVLVEISIFPGIMIFFFNKFSEILKIKLTLQDQKTYDNFFGNV